MVGKKFSVPSRVRCRLTEGHRRDGDDPVLPHDDLPIRFRNARLRNRMDLHRLIRLDIGLIIVEVAIHRIHGGRSIRLSLEIALRNRHGMLQAGSQRQALQAASDLTYSPAIPSGRPPGLPACRQLGLRGCGSGG